MIYTFQTVLGQVCFGPGLSPSPVAFFDVETDQGMTVIALYIHFDTSDYNTWKADE